MKVLYFGNFKSEFPTIDQDILYSLEKISEVFKFDIRESSDEDIKKIIEKSSECDFFLFHALIPETNDLMLGMIMERISYLLSNIKCKKVLWFFDKIMGNKVRILTGLEPYCDLVFVNDDTWLRRFDANKIFPLHAAAPEKKFIGKEKKELKCDIALVGSLYGERIQLYEFLKKKFGNRFRLFDDRFGQGYSDLCKSAKIIISPAVPFDDFFWSERIYTTLSNGGLCLHPRTYGLEEEGFRDGEHFISYYTEQDMFVAISMLIDKKSDILRKGISKKGQKFVKGHTYKERIKVIFDKINEIKSIK